MQVPSVAKLVHAPVMDPENKVMDIEYVYPMFLQVLIIAFPRAPSCVMRQGRCTAA